MTDHDPLAPIEALADDWAAKQRRNRECFVDGPIPMPKSPHLPPLETFEPVSELRAALAEAREALGEVTVTEEWAIHYTEDGDYDGGYLSQEHAENDVAAYAIEEPTRIIRRTVVTTRRVGEWEEV